MPSCIFCDIVERRIDAQLVYEDHLVVAFHDVAPKAPTHILVVPREHVADLDHASPAQELLLGHLWIVARDVAASQDLGQGYRVVVNRGEHGGQTVDHLHVHVLGGRPLGWPPG
jgi:histidine triad (HIT) family protein